MAEPQKIVTVGRTVMYRSYGTPGGEYMAADRAAIVTEVLSNNVVSLCVLNPEGMFFNRGVWYGPEPGCWHWPTLR